MRLVVASLLMVFSIGCQNRASTSQENAEAQSAALEFSGPIQAAALHNIFRITDKLISGSCPEGEPGTEAKTPLTQADTLARPPRSSRLTRPDNGKQ